MKTDLLYGIVASSKTRVRCIFCGVHIPKAKKCIEQHTNGSKHKENISLMTQEGIKEDNGVLHCRICSMELMENESLIEHVDFHSSYVDALFDYKEDDFINSDLYLAYESDYISCEVCNISFDFSFDNIQNHVEQVDHETNVIERLKPQNGMFRVDNDYEVWCKLCNTYVENTVREIRDHTYDEIHQLWFTDLLDLIDEQDVSLDDYLANEHEMHAFCNKCQIQIPCNKAKLEEHVYSDSHLEQFS
ncbi:hypothetical protein MSG28_009215 [Choristoneura fumiferana]|uniref:Uncharacterized protein n=1 Tax=Choristoneura fumiferana TaxID=7141 RepID=A0ACC0KWR4_CHOFU|nr:hypothetical protein MSG28_009215 [Choristoneura fumiferana]